MTRGTSPEKYYKLHAPRAIGSTAHFKYCRQERPVEECCGGAEDAPTVTLEELRQGFHELRAFPKVTVSPDLLRELLE